MMKGDRTPTEAATALAAAPQGSGRQAASEKEVHTKEARRTKEVMEGHIVAGSTWPEGNYHLAFRLLVYLCVLVFTPSTSRCSGPLQYFVVHSPVFLGQKDSPEEEKLLSLADTFALTESAGLLAALVLSSVVAPRSSPKALGLLCVGAAASGLLLSITAESTAAQILGLFFLGLTCATTNAVLPIVACFRNPALTFTIICATDFASVLPLQLLTSLVDHYALDLRRVLCVYVVIVYPLLFMLVIICVPHRCFPVAGAGFYKSLGATDSPKMDVTYQDACLQYRQESQGCGLTKEEDDRRIKCEDSVQRTHYASGSHETPSLWNLSLKEQLRSTDVYGVFLWWFAISIGLEFLNLYSGQSIAVQEGEKAEHKIAASHHAVLQKTSTWSAPCLILVLPALYCMHLGQLRWGMMKRTLRMTPEGIGLFASVFLALAGLLFTTRRILPCAIGMVIGNVGQALAPTAMFIMLTNAYGLKRLSLFQTLEIVFLAIAGFLMPFLRPWLTDKKSPFLSLPHVLLAAAVVSFVSLICLRCRRSRPPGSNAIHVLATGIPLALERTSMVAVFAQAGFPCWETDIPTKDTPKSRPNHSDERRALLASEKA